MIKYANARHVFLHLTEKYPDVVERLNIRSIEVSDKDNCFILTIGNPSSALFFELFLKKGKQYIRLHKLGIEPLSIVTKEYRNLGTLVYHNFSKQKR